MVVSDDHELTLAPKTSKHLSETADVGIVERGVDLVEDRERAWVDLVEGQHQGERRERSLPRGEKSHVLQPLARRLDQDLDAGAGPVVAFGVAQGGTAAG